MIREHGVGNPDYHDVVFGAREPGRSEPGVKFMGRKAGPDDGQHLHPLILGGCWRFGGCRQVRKSVQEKIEDWGWRAQQ